MDHKLATAFTLVLLMYTLVTLGAWTHLDQLQGEHHFSHHTVANAVQSKPLITSSSPSQPRNTINYKEIHDISTLQHTFPVHSDKDMEEIDHPAILLANKHRMKKQLENHPHELPQDGKMRVPQFWKPTAYGPDGVRNFLGNFGQRLMTPEEASQVGSFVTIGGQELETIYVSVASYRDPECRPTVEDIFLRAEYPERVRVAIIDQRAMDDDVPSCGLPERPCSEDPEQPMCKYHHLIDYYQVPAPLSVGPVFARHLANRMYRGEYFVMQADAHVRMTKNWDSDIIGQWKSAENEMAILSVYLSDVHGAIDPDTFESHHHSRPVMCNTHYEGKGKMKHLRHGQQPEGRPGIHGEPTLNAFWAAGFSFARGHFVVQVPYDQYLPMIFQGEEISIGLRGFTYGYDYYAPERSVSFHIYALKENEKKRHRIKKFWENEGLYPGAPVEAMKRLNGIIGMGDPEDTYYHEEETEYGLGKIRNKEKFFTLYGIHTDTQTVENHLCRFVGKPMQSMFRPHVRKNRMGINFDEFDFAFKDPHPSQKESRS